MSRRRLARRVGLGVAVAALLFAPWLPPRPFVAGPRWQAVTGERAVFSCTTAEPVQRVLAVQWQGRSVFRGFEAESAQWHEFVVDGLAPGRVYDWRLETVDGEAVERGRLRTRSHDDAARVRFAVLGDSGDQPFWKDLADAPATRALLALGLLPGTHSDPTAVGALLAGSSPTFWLHSGDVVYPRGELADYPRGFFRPFGAALRAAPCYPVAGNHDVMTRDGLGFDSAFRLPGAAEGTRHWTFRDGPVRFVGLDTNVPLRADSPALDFLREAAAHGEPWLVLVSHYPIHSVYRERPRPDLEQHLWPLCLELGVDVVFAGHDHLYQRFGDPGDRLPIEIGTGGGGKDLYEVRQRPARLVVAESVHHVCLIEVEGLELRCTVQAVDGDTVDAFVMVRHGADLPAGQVGRVRRVRALRR